MTKDFENFVEVIINTLHVVDEDKDYFRQIHEEKPLVKELRDLFPGDALRIKVPCGKYGAASKSWYDRFDELFASFKAKYGDAIDYEKGTVLIDKNNIKLFKAITAFYLNEYSEENFTRLKSILGSEMQWLIDNKPSRKLENYVILSRDPMDFYMAATNQPNSSCISLKSTNGHWEGICNALADPYRLMAYGTNGGQVTYSSDEIKGYPSHLPKFTLTADKFIARSWAMYDGKEKGIRLPRWFGSAPSDFNSITSEGITLPILSKSSFVSPRYRAIRIYKESPIIVPTVYFDYMTVNLHETDGELSNNLSGGSGAARATGQGHLAQRLGGRHD